MPERTLTPDELKDLENWFTYHPATDVQVEQYNMVRGISQKLAQYVLENVPPSEDRIAAIRSIRRSVMDINLAIACNE